MAAASGIGNVIGPHFIPPGQAMPIRQPRSSRVRLNIFAGTIGDSRLFSLVVRYVCECGHKSVQCPKRQ